MSAPHVVISHNYDPVIRTTLVTQLLFGTIAVLVLDGGMLARVAGVAAVGFWLCVAVLVLRRPFNPSKIEFSFIRWGFWPVLGVSLLYQALA